MSDVKRWTPDSPDVSFSGSDNGEWVRYLHYQALEAERDYMSDSLDVATEKYHKVVEAKVALEAERDALLVRAKAYERLIDSTGYDVRALTGYVPLGGGDEAV